MKKKSFLKPRKIVGGLLGPLVLLAVFPAPANAYPRPGITERVSVASDGAQVNPASFYPAISADGRYVAFSSPASSLVPGDTNGRWDLFVRDRVAGVNERVSVASDGAQANHTSSYNPAISADGRYVAFSSYASNLVPGDTNATWDVFVRDRLAGTTERVSVSAGGAEANSLTYYTTVAISGDGRYVVFESLASNLVPGDTNGTSDVFLRDRIADTTERVSVATGGIEANGAIAGDYSFYVAMSADGRYVAFSSHAFDLVPGDTNGTADVFVHDRVAGTTERVSVASDGTEGRDASATPALSADGRYVAFWSHASNLVPGDTNGFRDVFVRDRVAGATERVSVATDGAEANGASAYPAISADGRYVAFSSYASNLVPGDTNEKRDVFVHDRVAGATERVSLASDGAEANDYSFYHAISADGRYVVFESLASNLVPGDTNGASDVFVHDRGDSLGVVGTPSVLKVAGGVGVSGRATFSGAVVVSATDPPGDGIPGAGPAGAELTGASFTYRPEQEDLLGRLRLASLPSLNGAGAPAVLYGLRLTLGGAQYEVRALRAGATASTPSTAPYLALYRCDPGCTQQTALTGGIGTTGAEVRVSVPVAALGASEGAALSGIRAFTALGEAAPGAAVTLDQADLPSAIIPAPSVTLGIAPAGTLEEEVTFDTAAALTDGAFSGTIPTDGLSPGSYRVWTRACLGDACGPAAFRDVAL